MRKTLIIQAVAGIFLTIIPLSLQAQTDSKFKPSCLEQAERKIKPNSLITEVRTDNSKVQSELVLADASKFEEDTQNDSEKKKSYPKLGFGFGVSSYSNDFKGLRSAFKAIEEKYRNQGYFISSNKNLDFNASPLLWYHLSFRISQPLELLLEAGTNTLSTDVNLKAVSASMLFHFNPLGKNWFLPYVGAGVNRQYFKVERKYGDRISPYGSNGSYTYLAAINSEGSKQGYNFSGGLEIMFPKIFTLSAYLNYLLFQTLETTASGGEKVSLKMGGFLAGARLTVYL